MRLLFIASAIALTSFGGQANTSLELQVAQCSALSDNFARLNCFDKLSVSINNSHHLQQKEQGSNNAEYQTNSTQSTLEHPPEVADVSTATVSEASTVAVAAPEIASQATVTQRFGLQEKVVEDDVNRLYFEISLIEKDAYGAAVLTFTNGQIWKQSNPERYKLELGQKVYIEKGALSSFLLGSDGRNAKTRVKRIK